MVRLSRTIFRRGTRVKLHDRAWARLRGAQAGPCSTEWTGLFCVPRGAHTPDAWEGAATGCFVVVVTARAPLWLREVVLDLDLGSIYAVCAGSHGENRFPHVPLVGVHKTSNITRSHLHFGEPGVNGGIFLFLCTNLGNGPAGTPACPPQGTVTRTVSAADFVAVPAQNVPAGSFDAAMRILRSGDAYANVHTANFQAGEIRGQVRIKDDDD